MEIRELELGTIKPYWRNPRQNAQAIAAVAQSIHDYGYNSPIVVDTENVIIAGHTRYKALQSLGWTKVACVVADLPAAKAKEYRIADNKTQELASWDTPNLIAELREIGEITDLSIYFPHVDLDALIAETSGSAPNYATPSQDKINNSDAEMRNQFLEQNKQALSTMINLMCPECGNEFGVNRNDLGKELSEEA